MKPAEWYAKKYIDVFGMHLVPLEPMRKYPRKQNWGDDCISDSSAAEIFYKNKPNWGIGVALGPSNICSLDIDNFDNFSLICDCFGIDLDSLIKKTPTIKGRGLRLIFRAPDGVSLPYRKISWPSKNDPSGEKHKDAMRLAKEAKDNGDADREARIRRVAKRWASFCVFELRAATDGDRQRLDVFPPTIHPDTGQPYVWHTQPCDPWPEPPVWLQAIWKDWAKLKPQMVAMCPWAVNPDPVAPRSAPGIRYDDGGGVIDKFNASISLDQALDNYGYKRVGNRYLSPHSGTGLPGFVPFKDGRSGWMHHASDPLCSDESGKPVNAFDLYCYYEHRGDISKAVKAIADQFGLSRAPQRVTHTESTAPESVGDSPFAGQPPPNHPAAHQPSRDLMTPLPWTTDKGRPLKHIDNLREICRRLGVTIRYNVICKEEEILIPGERFSIDNFGNASFAWLTSECSLYQFSTDKLGDFVTYLADQNLYNPVAQWVGSKAWDGIDRLSLFYNTVTACGEDENESVRTLKESLIKRWMISAIAAAHNHAGVSAGGVLVFQGPQYLGKTKWFKTLVPPELKLLKDGMLLRPDDKDSVKQICSFWLVELGELDSTFRKSDIAALKAFITSDSDVLRRAFARKESHFARRTVFFGSVNPKDYLHDPTGNRRYWTIACEKLDHSHTIDMQQVWAQVKTIWDGGEGHHLTADEMSLLNEHNQGFTASDPVEDRIHSKLDWASPDTLWRWTTATEALIECGIDRPTRGESSTAGALIRSLNGGRDRRSNGRTLLLCPEKKTQGW